MALLAIDASTEACAVGIQRDDGEIFESFEVAPRRHTELLPRMLDEVIANSKISKKEIKGCVIGIGPGAFTGIRIGVATIQGIALGLNVPCYAVSSLHALAQQSLNNSKCTGSILACIDARMDEVYFAEYTVSGATVTHLVGKETMIESEKFSLPVSCYRVAGSGVACIEHLLDSGVEKQVDCYPTASALFSIFYNNELTPITPELLLPSYIRNNVTHQHKKT